MLPTFPINLCCKVHILNESRGSTLEVVTSRMKFRGSLIRFVLVSATVPNIQDVAAWIGGGFGATELARVFEVRHSFLLFLAQPLILFWLLVRRRLSTVSTHKACCRRSPP
jgi:hypothetical protein